MNTGSLGSGGANSIQEIQPARFGGEAAAHTAGPWSIDWNIARLDIHADGRLVAVVRRFGTPALDQEAQANARLLAAAPKLLKACQQALYALKGREHDQFLRDAIAEATNTQRPTAPAK